MATQRALREIVLDTETTGLDPRSGHRVVEIGCLELINRFPSGREWHHYFNPDRDMPREAFEIHGISAEFLADKPRMAELAADFLDFIGDATLVIHNAGFDINFLNHELGKLSLPPLGMDRVVDTLGLARRRHPGAQASLDALCKRYGIDTTVRTKHGALVDCKLLADVYVELLGERQARLELAAETADQGSKATVRVEQTAARPRPVPLALRLSDAERSAHAALVASLGPQARWSQWKI